MPIYMNQPSAADRRVLNRVERKMRNRRTAAERGVAVAVTSQRRTGSRSSQPATPSMITPTATTHWHEVVEGLIAKGMSRGKAMQKANRTHSHVRLKMVQEANKKQ